jgi:hypothetical protein
MQTFHYESTPFKHGAYVIHFMQEGDHSPFHAAARNTKTGEETIFRNLIDLLVFLQTRKSVVRAR